MSTLKERFADLAKDMPRGWKAQLARYCNVTAPSVSGWVGGETVTLEAASLLKAASFFRVYPAWLESGKVPKYLSDEDYDNAIEANIGLTRVPLIDSIQAGIWTEIVDNFQPGDADEWLLTDQRVSGRSFALEIKGDSMLPEFKQGDRVIIDPEVNPRPGDYVAAKNGGQEATFKKYRPRGTNAHGDLIFELVPLNEDFASIRSDIEPVRIVGTMIEHRRFRRPQ